MKSIHVFPIRLAISLAILVAVLGVVAPASAQGRGFTVAVERNGQRLTPSQIVLHAASDPKPGTLAGNVATFEADVVNASLEGKPVAVYVDECEDGTVGIHLVVDGPNAQAPPSPGTCRRRRLAAIVVIRRGSTIVVDVGRGTVVDTSSAV